MAFTKNNCVGGDDQTNLTTIGPVVSEIISLTKIDTDNRQTAGNGRKFFSHSWGHEASRKHESGQSSDGLYYNTSFTCVPEVLNNGVITLKIITVFYILTALFLHSMFDSAMISCLMNTGVCRVQVNQWVYTYYYQITHAV